MFLTTSSVMKVAEISYGCGSMSVLFPPVSLVTAAAAAASANRLLLVVYPYGHVPNEVFANLPKKSTLERAIRLEQQKGSCPLPNPHLETSSFL